MENYSKLKPPVFLYKGKYISNWFSNMADSEFELGGIIFKTVEHFYQSMKEENQLLFAIIAKAETPYEAKKLGSKVKEPFKYLVGTNHPVNDGVFKDVRDVKLTIMYIGLVEKFSIPEWKDRLLETGNSEIIEWNNWGDKFWGVDSKSCTGENHLGKLLMKIRDDIKI